MENFCRSFLHVDGTPTPDDTSVSRRIVYSYRTVMSGFAARSTPQEAKAMECINGFVSAYPDNPARLMTTHTPRFLGLHECPGFWKQSTFGEGVIGGVIDGGILPTRPSFRNHGMPPPPPKWKGSCEFNSSSYCNNEIIGARNFLKGAEALKGVERFGLQHAEQPFDNDGHGTHTASTAAGVFAKNADSLVNANGTAVGMAPMARLAVYKVCSIDVCTNSDILAGNFADSLKIKA
ncbi:hypothetical protein ACLOJK_006098 [Asimina triloba]